MITPGGAGPPDDRASIVHAVPSPSGAVAPAAPGDCSVAIQGRCGRLGHQLMALLAYNEAACEQRS
jgi:hypothetical protein